MNSTHMSRPLWRKAGVVLGVLISMLASLELFFFYWTAMTNWLGGIVGTILTFVLTPGIVVFPLIYWFVEGVFPSTYFILIGVTFLGGFIGWACSGEDR